MGLPSLVKALVLGNGIHVDAKQNRPGLNGPGLLVVVELPGIEPAPGDALDWEHARSDDLKVRQATRKHLGERAGC
jgi:hypothetical protein